MSAQFFSVKFAGVSADDLEQRLAEKADHTLISSSNNSVGNKLCSTSMVSPSIKSWLSKSLKKTKLESSEGQRSVDSTSVKNSDTGKVSIFQGNRLPCKRKLINEDSEDSGSFERFAKRQRVQDSPIKVSELRSPRKLEIKQSPRKIPPTLTGIVVDCVRIKVGEMSIYIYMCGIQEIIRCMYMVINVHAILLRI